MSFYTSLSGLKNAQTGLSVTANNIANAETLGFKKSRTLFSDLVVGDSPKMQQGIGSTVQSITQNFGMGPIEQTGGALDMAITGDGFFAVKNPATSDVSYTRNGAFTVDDSGFVKDGSGNRLQIFTPTQNPATDLPVDCQLPSQSTPPVTTPPTPASPFAGVSVGLDGSVKVSYADGTNETIGSVALATFPAVDGLKQTGSSNWVASGVSGAAEYGLPGSTSLGSVKSGSIERSNVDITEELVGLITMQRYFQANAKAIDTATQISQTVLNLRT
ncbi:flagellar hook basal-body protein [Novosphingobium sp. G106]|uniref:flagellar hook-basal body protein n=1 Tax=Novosphingobium sp. G106 TaxID=2849500 RepID=UPI001C2D8773|nr:flagellar hook basal-body protein [Novosphingobium sp. G106]MBV1690704.1 flagellar hook basal-body protein [Novosphingobium sp. G106]